jgi:Tol biopolymer transport system component
VGTVLGTVAYMSPEQAEGHNVDSRSDIFSFGVVLYEMATGRRPFGGSSKLSIMGAIVNNEPKPPRELAAGVPRDLERIILRCLRKDPAWRYQSAADLKISLADVERDVESGAAPPAVRTTGRLAKVGALAALLACVVLGAAGMWWFGLRNSAPGDSGYFVRPLTTYSGIEQNPALSPDGKQIAFTWNGDKKDNEDIYVRQVAGGPALRLTTDPGRDLASSWSPDGETIAFVRASAGASALYSVRALGGAEHKLFEFPQGSVLWSSGTSISRISWSPDGRLLAFSGAPLGEPAQIWILPLDTREPRHISTLPKGWFGDVNPAFSPDGRTLAYVRGRDLWSRAIIFQPIGRDGSPTGPPREMTDYSRSIYSLAWLPDGLSLVVALGADVWPTLSRFTPGKGFAALGLHSGVDPSVALKGARMAYTSAANDRVVYRMDGPGPDGGARPLESCHVSAVIDSTVTQTDIMFSPDGSRLAFVSPRTGYREVYVANADGSNQEALTSMGPTALGSPRWSPDGHWIAFDRYENGHSIIYAIRAEGGQPRRVTNPDGSDTRPSWSHDGKWIYFSSNRGGQKGIWKVAWPNAEPAVPLPAHPSQPAAAAFESADGKQLFYSDTSGIWSLPAGGGDPKLIVPEILIAQWALAGHSVYFVRRGAVQTLWVLRLDTGRQFEYVRFPAGLGPGTSGTTLTVTQDEKVICFVQTDRSGSDLMLVENFH